MTPEMEAAAWEGLATNAPAQQHAEGSDAVARWLVDHDQVVIDRERLAALEQLAATSTTDTRNDAGLLAFIVRDLMAAAGYRYRPDRPLTDQAHECSQSIRDTATYRIHFETRLALAERNHAAEVQRLTEATLEDDPAVSAWHAIASPIPGPAEWNALVYERDGLRKIVMDKDQELEELQRDPNVACSPDGLIWIKNSDGWCIFTPNGEYCQSEFGDELTDAQVADWPKGRLPDRVPPAVLGDIEVTRHD